MKDNRFAQLLGQVVIILSVVFVGLELRQNNRIARGAAYQAIGVATAELWIALSQNENTTQQWSTPPDSLEAADWARLHAEWTASIRLLEALLLQVEEDLLPEDAVDRLGFSDFRRAGSDPVFVCLWPVLRPGTSAAVRTLVEGDGPLNTAGCEAYPLPGAMGAATP